LKATYDALKHTNTFLSPDLWGLTKIEETPYEKYQSFLKQRN